MAVYRETFFKKIPIGTLSLKLYIPSGRDVFGPLRSSDLLNGRMTHIPWTRIAWHCVCLLSAIIIIILRFLEHLFIYLLFLLLQFTVVASVRGAPHSCRSTDWEQRSPLRHLQRSLTSSNRLDRENISSRDCLSSIHQRRGAEKDDDALLLGPPPFVKWPVTTSRSFSSFAVVD